ncbi:hypothetical protein N7528_008263 [Penicillium herquei]|nr:hypothetical protein N7528_008263 [Penicillium herquei]
MTIVHIVLFKFRADTSQEIRDKFVKEIKSLKSLNCVKRERLVVGGPSITVPAEKSKGFQYALVSYHEDRAALDAYQASSEHERMTANVKKKRVTSTYFIPYREDLVRFDFEVEQDDEPLLGF